MSEELKKTGNFQELRTAFFQYRDFVTQKKIPWKGYVSNKEIDLINNHIKYNELWTVAHAYEVYQILRRFSEKLKMLGVDVSKIPAPSGQIYRNEQEPKIKRQNHIGYNGEKFVLTFDYNPDLVTKVKASIHGVRWEKLKKVWEAPVSSMEQVKAFAEANNFLIGENALRIINGAEENLEQSYSADPVELNITLKKDLFPFQTVGVDFAYRLKRVIIGDEMGLGKTPQGIASSIINDQWPVLVVCPKSLRLNWKYEYEQWSDKKVFIANEKNMRNIHLFIEKNMVDVVICNFNGLEKYFAREIKKSSDGKLLVTLNDRAKLFKQMIIDEAHEARNPKTRKFKLCKKVADQMDYRILLTGTPIVNKPEDLASLIEIAGYIDDFGGRYNFSKRYSGATKHNIGKKGGSQNLQELNIKLRSLCFIRREKHQVLKELPDKIRSIKQIELSNRKEYDHAYLNLVDYLASKGASDEKLSAADRAQIIVQMQVLKKLSALGKLEDFKEFADSMMEQGEKLVVFVWHKELIAKLRLIYPDLLEISGDVNDEVIDRNKKLFQHEADHKLIVVTYQRGYAGHTLTAASNWCALELPWNYAIMAQAEDRCHRIGQLNTVYCHYFLGKNTIDEKIYRIIESKRAIGKEATGGTENIETIIQNELMKEISENAEIIEENID